MNWCVNYIYNNIEMTALANSSDLKGVNQDLLCKPAEQKAHIDMKNSSLEQRTTRDFTNPA